MFVFIHGPEGTGKTYLYRVILSTVRKDVVLQLQQLHLVLLQLYYPVEKLHIQDLNSHHNQKRC